MKNRTNQKEEKVFYDRATGLGDIDVRLHLKFGRIDASRFSNEESSVTQKSAGTCHPKLGDLGGPTLENIFITEEMVELAGFEDDILEWIMKSDENALTFAQNPVQAISGMGLKIDTKVLKKLNQNRSAFLRAQPDTPNIKIKASKVSASLKGKKSTNQLQKILKEKTEVKGSAKEIKEQLKVLADYLKEKANKK